MITADGPKLIEYNTRFGDPETQVLMMRLKDDLLVLLDAGAEGQLDHVSVRWRDETALTVVMAARGYPGTPEKGSVIRGIEAAEASGAMVFHAGTAEREGALVANGGRVLNVTATGADAAAAQAAAYAAVDRIEWPEGFCRRDIGWRAVKARPRPSEIRRNAEGLQPDAEALEAPQPHGLERGCAGGHRIDRLCAWDGERRPERRFLARRQECGEGRADGGRSRDGSKRRGAA